jgi:hypothetical protein
MAETLEQVIESFRANVLTSMNALKTNRDIKTNRGCIIRAYSLKSGPP